MSQRTWSGDETTEDGEISITAGELVISRTRMESAIIEYLLPVLNQRERDDAEKSRIISGHRLRHPSKTLKRSMLFRLWVFYPYPRTFFSCHPAGTVTAVR